MSRYHQQQQQQQQQHHHHHSSAHPHAHGHHAHMNGTTAAPPSSTTPTAPGGAQVNQANGRQAALHAGHSSNPPSALSQPRMVTSRDGTARILCLADIRGQLSSLNHLARQYDATHILHTGDFGFYEKESVEHMGDKTLRHVLQYSPLVPHNQRSSTFNTSSAADIANLRRAVKQAENPVLSELEDFVSGRQRLDVPVYTVYGACEDVRVLEKFRAGQYTVPNLNIVDESSSRLLQAGGLSLRLLGLGGAVVLHKLFDNGDGKSTIAGGQGTMWTTALQIGELLQTAERNYAASETRILMTHHSPGREGLLTQLAHTVKADFTISAGLHFRYGSSYNDYSVSGSTSIFNARLAASRANMLAIYEVVKPELTQLLSPQQSQLLDGLLAMVQSMPKDGSDISTLAETLYKNVWHFNLPDAQFGSLLLDVRDGKVSQEMRSQGFNFGYRRAAGQHSSQSQHPQQNFADKNSRTVSQAHLPPTTLPQQARAPHQAGPPLKPQQQPQQQQQQLPQSQTHAAGPASNMASTKPERKQKDKKDLPTAGPAGGKAGDRARLPPVPTAAAIEGNSGGKTSTSAATAPIAATNTPLPSEDVAGDDDSADDAGKPSAGGDAPPRHLGLWVSPCASEERARELFPSLARVETRGGNPGRPYCYVYFQTVEAMNQALESFNAKPDKEGVLAKEMDAPSGSGAQSRSKRTGSARGGKKARAKKAHAEATAAAAAAAAAAPGGATSSAPASTPAAGPAS